MFVEFWVGSLHESDQSSLFPIWFELFISFHSALRLLNSTVVESAAGVVASAKSGAEMIEDSSKSLTIL